MSTVIVRRPARRPAPDIPAGDIAVEPPPELPAATGSRWQQAVQLLPMLTGTVATALLFAGRSGDRFTLIVGAIFGLSTLGMLATTWSAGGGGPSRAEMMAARREYLRRLAALRRQVRDTADKQRTGQHYRHPDPGQLWSTVDSYRLWERRPGDPDFGVVRVGRGPQTLATPLIAPDTRTMDHLEPLTAGALRRFLDTYSVVPDLPVAVSLRGFARVHVNGDEPARALVRAMLAQLAAFHAPDDLLIAVCTTPERRGDWEWVKWLPHAMHPTRVDAVGPVRLLATSVADLERRLEQLSGPHLVVVADGHVLDRGPGQVTVIDLDGPAPRMIEPTTLALDVAAGQLVMRSTDDSAEVGVADQLSVVRAEALARQLAPRRLAVVAADPAQTPLARAPDLAELLGIGDADRFDPARAWAPRPTRDQLRVPIGVGPDGQPVEIDLKESALDGMGPHGLLIGATGSGKSELLRTLVLGLTATHPSETLNLVLVDFKGGATFASLDRLPHVAAVITNLVNELPLVDRMTDAINGELVRRQELLRRAGNYVSIRSYERDRAAGAPLAPLPSLLIVCDEFSELLTAKPEFIDLFVQIGRVGRSLGVHLLLASQRLEEGRLRGLDTHLSYRIGLRTFSAMESRSVLGGPDAYELPRSPGHGYLKAGTEPLVRFHAAYVSGPFHRATGGGGPGDRLRIFDYTTHDMPVDEPAPTPRPSDTAPSLLDLLVDRIAGQGVPAHQVWLPPLRRPARLDELFGPLAIDPVRGFTVTNPQLRGALQVPVALVDKPFEQRRDLLWLGFDGSAGHVAVVGTAGSGKSTLLRTLVTALALSHTPVEAQIYCLDFGGGTLGRLTGLPQVGGVAGRQDVTAVRRTISQLATLLASRERRFADLGVDSMPAYRRRRGSATGGAGDDPHGDVFLVIDGWLTLRTEFDDLEPHLIDIATRGLAYGIHIVAAAHRWTDFRPAVRDLFGGRLELRLGDPNDSEVDRRIAATVPDVPGRGVTRDKLHFLGALPQLTGVEPDDLVKTIANGWTGPPAPPVRLLPVTVPYRIVAADRDPANPLALPVGIAESDLGPVRLDFAADPHFLVFGDAECGKSTFLRTLARTITDRFPPERARLILVDYRRSLLDAVTTAHRIGYGTAAAQTQELMETAAGYMQRRLPGPDVTPQQLRERSWWTGPQLFVLIDDYDLVATGPQNPLEPMLAYLPQARDIGLHLVLTRRTGGASRAMYEPVIQRLRELSSPGLIMSGDRDEGALLGNVRPGPLPPGRGRLVTRRHGVRLIQLADLPTE